MNQASQHSRRAPLKQRRAPARYAASLVATCLVLLQLVTALHFALIPHRFSAGLNGFVHVHGAPAERAAVAPRTLQSASQSASLVSERTSCVTESCPVGFAGAHSVLLAAPGSGALLALTSAVQAAAAEGIALARSRVLLSAPKTSPPSSRSLS